jgi:hypothetical protein
VCSDCDGRLESHPDAVHALDEDCKPAFSAWPGGPTSPVCVDWAARDPWVSYALQAARWSNAGQAIGALDDLPAALVDAVLTVRAEWDAVEAERIRRDSSR